MTALHIADKPLPDYRPCVGIMLLNAEGHVFVGQRIDVDQPAWQMPQGGIDPGEAYQAAALRELKEEIGTDRAQLIRASRKWFAYDFPASIAARTWRGQRYRGQVQRWCAYRFTGEDQDIDLATEEPEFSAWRWVAPDDLVPLIVPFKRDVYRTVLSEFTDLLTRAA